MPAYLYQAIDKRGRSRNGSLSAQVHRAAGPNDFRVATPVATAAVAGTSGDTAYTADYGFAISGWTGVWEVTHGRDHRSIRAGEQTDDELTNPVYLKELHGTVQLGDTSGGLVNAELYVLREYGDGRGYLNITGPGGSAGVTTPTVARPSGSPYTPPGGGGTGGGTGGGGYTPPGGR